MWLGVCVCVSCLGLAQLLESVGLCFWQIWEVFSHQSVEDIGSFVTIPGFILGFQ